MYTTFICQQDNRTLSLEKKIILAEKSYVYSN